MPRRISGLGGGTRIPLRGLSKLLQNLPAAERDRLESAFADAENLLDFYDQSVRDKQTKRKLSGLVDSPTLEIQQSILGASVRFERLDDPRISFYEIQVDDINVFPNPESFQVVDPFFALDGLTSIKYIRARGVRGTTGETGNWSNTVTARPVLTAPKAYSWQFYQRYSGAEPNIFKKVRYGGEDTPKFYTLLDTTFYGSRLVGGMALWGMVSNRLKKPLDSRARPWDRIKFTINGLTRMENYFPIWTNTFFDTDTPQTNPSTGLPLSFYGTGGYTASFGPYNLAVPVVERGQGPLDPTAVDDKDAPGAAFYWSDEQLIFRPSRLDTGQLDSYDDFDHKGREAEAGVGTNSTTSYLIAKKFNFKIPRDEDIQGIDVRVKRRQLNYPAVPRALLPLSKQNRRAVTADVQFDYGKHPNKRLLEANYNQTNQLVPAVGSSDIKTDTAYGRFVELAGVTSSNNIDFLGTSGRAGLTIAPQVGTVDNFNTFIGTNAWTISTWVNPYLTTADIIQEIWAVAGYSDLIGTQDRLLRLQRGRATGAGTDFAALTIENAVGGTSDQTYTSIFTTLNRWYHLVVKYSGGTLTLFVDAVPKSPSSTSGPFSGFPATNLTFGNCFSYYQSSTFAAGLGRLNGGQGQTGIWNKALTNREIEQLFKMRMNSDYRYNQRGYDSADNLMHYYLFLPEEPQISDYEVYLHDQTGIRTDLDNKADVDLWPQLDRFFYAVSINPDGTLQARSQGIPHDNVIGVGYQTYGSQFDLWGEPFFTHDEVEHREFGVAIRAQNAPRAYPGVAFVDHVKMAIYTRKPGDNSIRVQVKAEASNQFYTEREVFGGLFNAIETGEIAL